MDKAQQIELKTFLETVPPGKSFEITNFFTKRGHESVFLNEKDIQLHCSHEDCDGVRFFSKTSPEWVGTPAALIFVQYVCRNCGITEKTFAIAAQRTEEGDTWELQKLGEFPPFGPPTPSRAVSLIGGERELFFMGRRCENQGMGIGAFVYYRRVIESQKNRIFDEISRVIRAVSPNDAVLDDLARAKQETQFTSAVDTIKHALPQSLQINGYNPLTLLHSALSEGVHTLSDEECLKLASGVRTVLIEFAERLGSALKDDAELSSAVTLLANKRGKTSR